MVDINIEIWTILGHYFKLTTEDGYRIKEVERNETKCGGTSKTGLFF